MANQSKFASAISYHSVKKSSPDGCKSKQLPVTQRSRSDALVRGLNLLLHHHGASNEILHALDFQVHAYLDSSIDECVWLKRSKFLLAYPLAKYLRNDSPPPPDLIFRPSGCLRRWMKQRFICFNRKNTHLWYSWYQGKRCSLPCSDDFVNQTYADHLKSLTQPDPGNEETIERIFKDETFLHVLDIISKSVKKQLSKKTNSFSEFNSQNTSQSASFNNTRGSGGQVEELRDLCSFDPIISRLSDTLLVMRDGPLLSRAGIRYHGIWEERSSDGTDWSDLKNHSDTFSVRQGERRLSCCIQAILEPFKVRVISKGEALPYYSMKYLQKALHTSMRKMPCFKLIGQPFSPTHVMDLKEGAHPEDEWFSIDYSAATDGLSWKYSGRILRYILKDLSDIERIRALQVLGPHDLYYPSPDGKTMLGTQNNGQLMGSILSFPILCLSNLGVYLLNTADLHLERFLFESGLDVSSSYEWHKYRLSRVLVNGDDMLYASPRNLWPSHSQISSEVGLKMSVGKAYIHPIYANINSTSIHCSMEPNCTPYQIDFLNTGLYFGQHKVQGTTDSSSFDNVLDDSTRWLYDSVGLVPKTNSEFVVNINQILKGALPGKQAMLLSSFLVENNKAIKDECTAIYRNTSTNRRTVITRNLFLPLSLGGMGVDQPVGFKSSVTEFQRRLSYDLYNRLSSTYVDFSRPLRGYELERVELWRSQPWSKPSSVGDIQEISSDGGLSCSRSIPFKILRQGLIHVAPNRCLLAA